MPDIQRWTVNCLPDAATTAVLAAYADNPMFDDIVRGYRAGSGHGTKAFSHPHATSVHFECTEEDFEEITKFISGWIAENSVAIQSTLKEDSFTKPVLIDVPAGYTAYYTDPTDSDVPTCWVDFNLVKDPFLALNVALVGFIKELSEHKGYEIKIINGVLDKHRPHFTAMRADAAKAKALDFPASPLSADQVITFTVSAGPSPKSGEYHEPKYLFTTAGVRVPFAPPKKKEVIAEAFKLHQASSGSVDQATSVVGQSIRPPSPPV
jgi:hypothetical protein